MFPKVLLLLAGFGSIWTPSETASIRIIRPGQPSRIIILLPARQNGTSRTADVEPPDDDPAPLTPVGPPRPIENILSRPQVNVGGRVIRFTIISRLLDKTSLTPLLAHGAGPTTAFLPSDQAFSRLPARQRQELQSNPILLRRILLCHMTPQTVTPSSFSNNQRMPSSRGTPLLISVNKNAVRISGARVLATIPTTTGVIYIINRVLYPPPAMNLTHLIAQRYPQLYRMLNLTDLLPLLNGPGTFTIFAPPEESLAALNQSILSDPTQLRDILMNHIVPGTIYARQLEPGNELTSLANRELPITRPTETGPVFINNCPLLKPDQTAGNGVLHQIGDIMPLEPSTGLIGREGPIVQGPSTIPTEESTPSSDSTTPSKSESESSTQETTTEIETTTGETTDSTSSEAAKIKETTLQTSTDVTSTESETTVTEKTSTESETDTTGTGTTDTDMTSTEAAATKMDTASPSMTETDMTDTEKETTGTSTTGTDLTSTETGTTGTGTTVTDLTSTETTTTGTGTTGTDLTSTESGTTGTDLTSTETGTTGTDLTSTETGTTKMGTEGSTPTSSDFTTTETGTTGTTSMSSDITSTETGTTGTGTTPTSTEITSTETEVTETDSTSSITMGETSTSTTEGSTGTEEFSSDSDTTGTQETSSSPFSTSESNTDTDGTTLSSIRESTTAGTETTSNSETSEKSESTSPTSESSVSTSGTEETSQETSDSTSPSETTETDSESITSDGTTSPTSEDTTTPMLSNLVQSTEATEETTSESSETSTNPAIEDILDKENFTIFFDWLDRTGLRDEINTGKYTVAAPSDDAIEQLPPTLRATLEADVNRLRDYVRFHIIPKEVVKEALQDGDLLPTVGGNTIPANVPPGGEVITLAGARIISDVKSPNSNLRVLTVDKVLAPPPGNLYQTISKSPLLKTFTKLIHAAGMEKELKDPSRMFTVLAPMEFAYRMGMPRKKLRALLKDPKAARAEVEKYIIPRAHYSSGIKDGSRLTTLDGTARTFRVQPCINANCVDVDKSSVLFSDLGASNGVVHVLEEML